MPFAKPRLFQSILFIFILFSIILIHLLITTSNVQAQVATTPSPTKPVLTITPTNTPNDINSVNQVAILQAQLETMRFYDQSLLATVYWSLGTVVTITLLVAGFSWFTNFRVYERDKEFLRREFSLQIEKQGNELQNSLPKMISDQFKDELNEINSEISYLKREQERNYIKLNFLEAKVWTIEGVHRNAIRLYLSALEEAVENDQSSYFSSLLNGILGAVDKISYATTYDIADFEKVFNKLPAEHNIICNSIRQKLQEKLS